MKALVLNAIKTPLALEDHPAPSPAAGEAVVALKAAALNRRDYWITQGMYPGIMLPVVLGSDGAGVVASVGTNVDAAWQGREVIIDPGLDWGDSEAAQSTKFHILGLPRDGTFADQVVVPATQLHDKPLHLTWQEAAALPLAGVTAYRALFSQGGLQRGDALLITGIGGGVATFALQFAIAAGANVWVTSSSDEKIARAVALGAKGGFNYKSDSWPKEAAAARPDHRQRRRVWLCGACQSSGPRWPDRQLRRYRRPTGKARSLQSVLEAASPARLNNGLASRFRRDARIGQRTQNQTHRRRYISVI
jgi:zinc-binding alcohol dehydrogenase/oxidoreductase